MKVKDLIKQLQNLKQNVEIDFLYINSSGTPLWLKIKDICMNQDIDDPRNINRAGIVYVQK